MLHVIAKISLQAACWGTNCQRISIEKFLKQYKVYQKTPTIFIQLYEKYLKIKHLKQRLSIHRKFFGDFALKLWKCAVIIHFKNTENVGQWATFDKRYLGFFLKYPSNLLIVNIFDASLLHRMLQKLSSYKCFYQMYCKEDIEGKFWTHLPLTLIKWYLIDI